MKNSAKNSTKVYKSTDDSVKGLDALKFVDTLETATLTWKVAADAGTDSLELSLILIQGCKSTTIPVGVVGIGEIWSNLDDAGMLQEI